MPFSLAVGTDISYSGGGDENPLWGPAAIAVGPNDSVWIADGAGDRVLEFTWSGKPVQVIDLEGQVVSIGDIEVSDTELAVLDIAAQDPTVLVFDPSSGKLVSKRAIPKGARLEDGLTGIAILADGSVAAELNFGTQLVKLGTSAGDTLSSYDTIAGTVQVIGSSKPAPTLGDSPTITINGHTVRLPVTDYPGTLHLVGSTRSSFLVSVEELAYTVADGVQVDETVRVLDATGSVVGVARFPLNEVAVHINEPITTSQDGEIVALVALADRVDVAVLAASDSVEPILPRMDAVSTIGTQPVGAGATSCVSRATMRTTDVGYRINSHYYSTTNIYTYCLGRGIPGYLNSGGAGTYSSVSYKWGGFDTVSSFNSGMSPGTKQAGDTTKGDTLSCARGVDCSGFVSRVWQLSSKYGTWTLDDISTQLSGWGNLLEYDIFLKQGSHVRLFRYYSGNGYYVSESTTAGYDRVVYRLIGSSDLNGYSPWRYDNVCP